MVLAKKITSKLRANKSERDGAGPDSQETILITGASGFVAAYIVDAFLEAGYFVRGTVRSEEVADRVRNAHSQFSQQLSFAIVSDIADPGCFDEAVEGVHGVVHTASPSVLPGHDPEEDLLIPSMDGTTNILEAVAKHAPNVERIVITSSFAAMIDMHKGLRPGHTYTESDWNPESYEAAKKADVATAFCASKALAERTAFEYVRHHQPKFSIATICPPMIFGPAEPGVASISDLSPSASEIYHLMDGTSKRVPATAFWAYCDVRDVAEAHLKAYESSKAANQRFFLAGGRFSYQMACDALRKIPEIREKVPPGVPGSRVKEHTYDVDGSKASRILGIQYKSLETSIQDMARSLMEIDG